MDSRSDDQERLRHEKKETFKHIMRAKLYGVIAINTLEGITSEIDSMLPYECEKGYLERYSLFLGNIDPLSDQYRKYRGGVLYPTSYGDHLDRAVKSLGKDFGIAVTVELANTQAVKVADTVWSLLLESSNQVNSCSWRRGKKGDS